MDLSRYINMKLIKPPVFLLCLTPLAHLALMASRGGLGANPVEAITHSTGTWALVFLCVTLSTSPLRRLLHQNWLIRFRRMLGLFAFSYGFLHVATYVWLDKSFDLSEMVKDIYKRPFIAPDSQLSCLWFPSPRPRRAE